MGRSLNDAEFRLVQVIMTKSRAVYDALAPIYDEWLSGDTNAECCYRFYTNLSFRRSDRILELGVGTGRIACALAGLGFNVAGIDASPEMLERATVRCNSEKSPMLVLGLFESIPFDSSSFDWAICPMRTIGHLASLEQRIDVFKEVHRVLRPGGLFVFDHYRFNLQWAQAHDGKMRLMYEGPSQDPRATRTWETVRIWDKYEYFYTQNSLHCTVTIERVGETGRAKGIRTVQFNFCWFDSKDVAELAGRTGFDVIAEHDDFDWQDPNRAGKDFVWFLRKTGQ